MSENENPTSGPDPASKGMQKKSLLIGLAFVAGLVLLIALNMK